MADDSQNTDPLQDGEQTMNGGEILSPGEVQRSRSDTDIVDKSTLEASSVNKVDGEEDTAKEKSEKDLSVQDKALMSEFKSLMKKVKVGSVSNLFTICLPTLTHLAVFRICLKFLWELLSVRIALL